MPSRSGNNFAFIDAANLHLGVQNLGWKLDYRRFRVWLRERFAVQKAYIFIGYQPVQADLYRALQEFGYIVEFKPVLQLPDGKVKGNCDAELVLRAMIDLADYERAVIITGDGDFHCLVKYLDGKKKLETLIAPSHQGCSSLLKKLLGKRIIFLDHSKEKLGYRLSEKKRTPSGRNPAGDFSS